ncbi:Protein kinase domain containing protein [Spraguea lophii 42_110]|uniref:cAMP-dependent protein kinase n=1 Tax=Spraguea lophii (strain 42_110) TaxID=1358809 RepID=S7W5J1_SPRLO|nr:Protein kinase domain containing protein [Spraguea lophii 42_110]
MMIIIMFVYIYCGLNVNDPHSDNPEITVVDDETNPTPESLPVAVIPKNRKKMSTFWQSTKNFISKNPSNPETSGVEKNPDKSKYEMVEYFNENASSKSKFFSKVLNWSTKSRDYTSFSTSENEISAEDIDNIKHNNIIKGIKKYEEYSRQSIADFMKIFCDEIEKIGEGGYGSVYLYRTKKTKDYFAGKHTRLRNTVCSKLQEYVVCKTLIKLDHKNIIKIYKVFRTRENMLILMSYENGVNLFKKICLNILTYDTKRKIMAQVAEGVVFLHGLDIVHGDLSPVNILVNEDYAVKLIDFGFSKIMKQGEELHFKSSVSQHTSPERHKGTYRHSDDYYSLGICIFFAHEEDVPYDSDYLYERSKGINKSSFNFTQHSPHDQIDIILRLTRYDLENRLGKDESDVQIMRKHKYFENTVFEG